VPLLFNQLAAYRLFNDAERVLAGVQAIKALGNSFAKCQIFFLKSFEFFFNFIRALWHERTLHPN
jgi:hypothetical protein